MIKLAIHVRKIFETQSRLFTLPFSLLGFLRTSKLRAVSPTASPALAVTYFLLFLGVSFLLTGCASSNIHDVNSAFLTVRKTVVGTFPFGLRQESENGRELYSGYFDPKNWDEDATEKTERAYAKVVILNASRPYDVDAHVYREKRGKTPIYHNLGEDRKLTKQLLTRLLDGLADRHDDRNIIDDFRAF